VLLGSSGRCEPQGRGRAQSYVRVNLGPFYLSWFLSFGMVIALSCSERLRKQYPLNYCFLVRPPPPSTSPVHSGAKFVSLKKNRLITAS
jgi:hypothetical protein